MFCGPPYLFAHPPSLPTLLHPKKIHGLADTSRWRFSRTRMAKMWGESIPMGDSRWYLGGISSLLPDSWIILHHPGSVFEHDGFWKATPGICLRCSNIALDFKPGIATRIFWLVDAGVLGISGEKRFSRRGNAKVLLLLMWFIVIIWVFPKIMVPPNHPFW